METTPLEIERMLLKIEKLSYSITSFVQAILNAQRSSFHTFSPIGRDFTRYQLEKNSREETKQEAIKLGQLLETGFFFFFEREREREKGSKHGRDVFRKTNEISFHERGRHRREGCCCALHASKVYRACIYERLWSLQFERTREPATIKFPSRKFSNTLIIGSLLSLYLIRNAIFVRIFGVISFPSLVCPPPFQQKLSTFEKRSDQVFHSLSINTFR